MILVQEQPEPADFTDKVKVPGQKFLRKKPKPTSKEFKNHNYWTKTIGELHAAYNGICAYSAHWISGCTTDDTVDHFIPKSKAPELAYEWSNFRLCSPKMNRHKGDSLDVLDPFFIKTGWFVMNFTTYLIEANTNLPQYLVSKINETIRRLKLNDDDRCVKDRKDWLFAFFESGCPLEVLESKYPFMAHELRRQGIVEEIKVRMRRSYSK